MSSKNVNNSNLKETRSHLILNLLPVRLKTTYDVLLLKKERYESTRNRILNDSSGFVVYQNNGIYIYIYTR